MIPAGIISSDGHICEPPNCYTDYIDPKYRDTAPRVVEQADGTEAFVVHGMKRPVPLGFIDGAGFSVTERNDRAKICKFPGLASQSGTIGPKSVNFRIFVRVPTAAMPVFRTWIKTALPPR